MGNSGGRWMVGLDDLGGLFSRALRSLAAVLARPDEAAALGE